MTTQFVADIADVTDAPWRSVVLVQATFPDGNTFTGSGVLVGRNDVLTASHVVFSEPNGGVAQSITVYPGRDLDQSPFGAFQAASVDYLEWDLDGDGLLTAIETAQDFAVLGFDEPLGDEIGWFGIDPNALTDTYNLTGYPGAFFVNGEPRMTTDSGVVENQTPPGVWFSIETEAFPGNSGGPLWYEADGIPFVVGVLSAGDGTVNVSGDVFAQFETIIGWMEGNNGLLSESDSTGTDVDAGDGVPVDPDSGVDAVSGVHLEGTARNDTVTAGAGNDVLVGGAGADQLDGGAGTDWAFYTTSTLGVTVSLSGTSTGSGGDAQGDVLTNIENLRGSAVGDTLTGSSVANIIEGGSGSDTIFGLGGADLLRGSHGNDTIDAGGGSDAAVGGPGNDTILGGSGADALRGNSQNDVLDGGAGADRVYGNIGGDTVRGGDDDDFLWGLSGNDRLDGGAGADWLYGGWGGDILLGGAGPDFLRGDGGRDIFLFDVAAGMPDTIVDLETAGSDHDLIDLHRWFALVDYSGTTPIADGIARVLADGPYARIQVQEADGGWASVAIAADTRADTLADDRYFVTGSDYWFGD